MNKNELITEIVDKTGLGKANANRALNAVTETITEALKKGESVPLIGFGTFEVRDRSARTGRNPQMGEEFEDQGGKGAGIQGRHRPQGDDECSLRVCLSYFVRAAIPCTKATGPFRPVASGVYCSSCGLVTLKCSGNQRKPENSSSAFCTS